MKKRFKIKDIPRGQLNLQIDNDEIETDEIIDFKPKRPPLKNYKGYLKHTILPPQEEEGNE